MTDQPWWERWPQRYARELAELDAAGIQWQRDESALARGVLCLDLALPTDDGELALRAVFPDNYPYFRFLIYAPTLDLPYHQNPFERNLCLLPRRTHYWNTTDTVAKLLTTQLPKLLATARSMDLAAVDGLEQRQAEPFSDYYRYPPSMIMVQSDWTIEPEHARGHLVIGTPPSDRRPDTFIRGAVLEVRAENRDVLHSADEALRKVYSGRLLDARWARVRQPISEPHQGNFIAELGRLHPTVGDARPNHVQDGWLRIWGVLFPEQTGHRTVGEGWVFVCALDKQRPDTGASRPHFKQAKANKGQKRNYRHR